MCSVKYDSNWTVVKQPWVDVFSLKKKLTGVLVCYSVEIGNHTQLLTK